MIFIKVLLALLAAHLIKGQVLGQGHREATEQERRDHFKSQVMVQVRKNWRPTTGMQQYMAMINIPAEAYQFHFEGSGTILNDRWILTAAHLFNSETLQTVVDISNDINHGPVYIPVRIRSRVEAVRVLPGKLAKLANSPDTVNVERVLLHPDFKRVKSRGDIALLQLGVDLIFQQGNLPNQQPVMFASIDLPPHREMIGLECKVSGWGQTEADNGLGQYQETVNLRWGETRIVPRPQNYLLWAQVDVANTDLFYVGMTTQQRQQARVSIGKGDSGGGLLCVGNDRNTYVFGVAMGSLSDENNKMHPSDELGMANLPSLYTSVYEHMQWVNDHIQNYRNRPRRRGQGEHLIVRA